MSIINSVWHILTASKTNSKQGPLTSLLTHLTVPYEFNHISREARDA